MKNGKIINPRQIPRSFDVAAIRAKTRYSRFRCYTQEDFARSIGVSVGTVRQWEQGRRQPTGAARVLLALLDREPALLERILDA
jgi:putative transcriptional regulator